MLGRGNELCLMRMGMGKGWKMVAGKDLGCWRKDSLGTKGLDVIF